MNNEFKTPKVPTREVKLLDLAILLFHVHKGAEDNEVGFEDANRTFPMVASKLNRTVRIDQTLLESALWSCNLLDEQSKFWHPKLTFEEWAKSLVGKDSYNRRYCTIDKKD